MGDTAAVAARGSGSSPSPPPSPPQHTGSTDTEVEDRCPICLDSWREPSFVMPCLHRFCYACILRWANNKTQCPLCKGKMTSILHSVEADDDFEEHVIAPPATPPAVVPPRRRARREPDAPNPGAHQREMAAQDVQNLIGGFQLPNWMSCFSGNTAIQQTLHSLFCQDLEMMFGTATPRAQSAHVPEQRRRREDHHLPRQQDTRGANGQEDSSTALAPGPARPRENEMPGTSSTATGGGPATHASVTTTTTHMEQQESPEEPERQNPAPPNSSRGRDPSPGGPRRPQKRRASSPKGSPARRRPRQ